MITRARAETLPVFNVGFSNTLEYDQQPSSLGDTVRVYASIYNNSPQDVIITTDCTSNSAISERLTAPLRSSAIVVVWCDMVMRSTTERITARILTAKQSWLGVASQPIAVVFPVSPILTLEVPSELSTTTTQITSVTLSQTVPGMGATNGAGTGGAIGTSSDSHTTTTSIAQVPPSEPNIVTLTTADNSIPSNVSPGDNTSIHSSPISTEMSTSTLDSKNTFTLNGVAHGITSTFPSEELPTPHTFNYTRSSTQDASITTIATENFITNSSAQHENGSLIGSIIAAFSGSSAAIILPAFTPLMVESKPTVTSTAAILVHLLVDATINSLPTPETLIKKTWNTTTMSAITSKIPFPSSSIERIKLSTTSTAGKTLSVIKKVIESSTQIFVPRLEKTVQVWQATATQEANTEPIPLLAAGAQKLENYQNLIQIPREKIPSIHTIKSWIARSVLHILNTWWLVLPLYMATLYLLWRLWRSITYAERERRDV